MDIFNPSYIMVIVIGIMLFLLKMWVKHDYKKDIEELKHDMDINIREIQTELDKTILAHRVQFETEFETLKLIWTKLSRLRKALAEQPQVGTVELTPKEGGGIDIDKIARKGRSETIAAFNEFNTTVEDNSPFYDFAIYTKCKQLSDECRQDIELTFEL